MKRFLRQNNLFTRKNSLNLKQVDKIFQESKIPKEKHRIGFKIAEKLLDNEQFPIAYHYYKEIYDIALKNQIEDNLLEICYGLCESAYNLEEHIDIPNHITALLEIARKKENNPMIVYASIKYVEHLLNELDLTQTEEILNDIKGRTTDVREIAQINFFFGLLNMKKKNFDTAREYLNIVLKYAEENNKKILYGEVMVKLSIIESNFDLKKALDLAEKVYKLGDLIGNDDLIEKAFDNIRYITIALFKNELNKIKEETDNNNNEKVKLHYKEAISYAKTFKDSTDTYENVLFNYSLFLFQSKEYKESEEVLKSVEEIAKDKDSESLIKSVLGLKYQLYVAQEDYKKSTEILELLYPEKSANTFREFARHCIQFKDYKKAHEWYDQLLIFGIENFDDKIEKEALEKMRNLKKMK